ncbi:MAG: metalloregulator ArsR/SmtB family transcription factor [Gemmata sp.]|nr:metalloregulator ArsR/SmtB family transcription factor [Gemmata sp.]
MNPLPPSPSIVPAPCPVKPGVEHRPLLGGHEAAKLMALFKVLANDTRLRLLHALIRGGEVSVGDLARELGMKPQAVSNQLQRLADRGMVASTRAGNRLLYRIADRCVPILLERAWCLIEEMAGRNAASAAEPA